MKIQVMPPGVHQCMLYSLAMIIDQPATDLMKQLGVKQIKLWPNLPEPLCYRSVCIEECQDLLIPYGKMLGTITAMPAIMSCKQAEPHNLYPEDVAMKRINYYSRMGRCMIEGVLNNGIRHCVAYHKGKVYDPRGADYKEIDFRIERIHVLLSTNDSIRKPLGTPFAN